MCELFIKADAKLWESTTRSLRIDGMVTIAMGVGAATAAQKPKKKSVYASRGVIRV